MSIINTTSGIRNIKLMTKLILNSIAIALIDLEPTSRIETIHYNRSFLVFKYLLYTILVIVYYLI